MTQAQQILSWLQDKAVAACDDCIAQSVGLKYRQQARARCIELAEAKRVKRDKSTTCALCHQTKTCTWVWNAQKPPAVPAPTPAKSVAATPAKPWYWEGHVQNVLIGWLSGAGWEILQVADTAAKSPGKDIVARKSDRELWVSVKGYPQGIAKTNPSTQARHWFSHAMFDLLLYRTESTTAELAIGLPLQGVTYRNLIQKSGWALANLPASIMWVHQNGTVWIDDSLTLGA